MAEKIFFYYCLLLVLFMMFSGLFSSSRSTGGVNQLLLLPLLVYFVIAFWQRVRKGNYQGPTFILRSKGTAITLVVFFLLTFVGFLAVKGNSNAFKKISTSTPTSIPHPTPVKLLEMFIITVDPFRIVNIRENPSTSAKVISKAEDGQKFTIISQKDGWFEVLSEQGLTGWVKKEFGYIATYSGKLKTKK